MLHLLYKIISNLMWLGLIGIIGDISGISVLKYFWLFFLLGFIEVFRNLPVFCQSLLQILSYPVLMTRFRLHMPSAENYVCKTKFRLPFDGQWYVVNGGTDRKTSHSWGMWPQRYAYDFYIIDVEGKSCSGDKTTLENYYCYGKNILAPADGEVICVKSHYPNSKTYGDGSAICKAWDIRGNYIIIKHTDDEYSTIAHIMPESITVKEGERVIRGQIIAKAGNSGNTTEPHIHFQLNNGKSFFTSAGLPFRFSNISINGGKPELSQTICRGQYVNNN